MIFYDPADHYWIIGGGETQVYSSARMTTVPVADETYVAWSVEGQATRITSMGDLAEVLRAANVAPYRTVTPLKARRVLRAAGLIAQVDAAVNNAGGDIYDAWNYASEIYEADPSILQIAGLIGLTSDQVFDLFSQASAEP